MKVQFGLSRAARFSHYFFAVTLLLGSMALLAVLDQGQSGASASPGATYASGVLKVELPYHAPHAGAGTLTVEVLDPDDAVLGRTERGVQAASGSGEWAQEVHLSKKLALEDLVWHRLRYSFTYQGEKAAAFSGIEPISRILRTPVVHLLGQNMYLSGAPAAVRLIVKDSKDGAIVGAGSVEIALVTQAKTPQLLFSGRLDSRGTTEAQFRFPNAVVGNATLRFTVGTAIGSSEFNQNIHIADKVSILLTTDKPIYQPGQMIHVRALALDRADHHASGERGLTFEVEDSRGNKVFRKITRTDKYGIASAEFGLADEVNLGAYHLRALMDDAAGNAPNTTEIALNVERYVLPKFKVAVELAGKQAKSKRGYRPGDHVTGTIRANYFFGKPVDDAEITVKATGMDVSEFAAGKSQGKTDADGAYRFDIPLPTYFAGRPLSQGAAKVLMEATVKDNAGHSETRAEPITVSESPLLITAVPEGGTMIPGLENEVFLLTSYPDGTPAQAEARVRVAGNADQTVNTDASGVAIVSVRGIAGEMKLEVEASDREGNQATSSIPLEARADVAGDQILLRTERAVYRTGERMDFAVFTTKRHGAAYIDVIKDGQTIETRDLDIVDGKAHFQLTAAPQLAGTVECNAYLFGADARPVADHRLLFVEPSDELKVDTSVERPVYKPGEEARIAFRVTDAKGQGVAAALGVQIVDEAVFALAEKRPGFAKVFFYLEQEVMKPRYEIHSLDLPDTITRIEPTETGPRDRAARALFSATDLVRVNALRANFGQNLEQVKAGEYATRYAARFDRQVREIAEVLNREYPKNAKAANLPKVINGLAAMGKLDLHDPWGNSIRFDPMTQFSGSELVYLRSAGPDGQLDSSDDLVRVLRVRSRVSRVFEGSGDVDIKIGHDRGAFNGLAEITGSVEDTSGAVVSGATVEASSEKAGKTRKVTTDASGQFRFAGVSPGLYQVKISSPGFKISSIGFTVKARDRAVLDAKLKVLEVTQAVEVTAMPVPPVPVRMMLAAPEARFARADAINLAAGQEVAAQNMGDFTRLEQFAKLQAPKPMAIATNRASGTAASPEPHVRSYFPEALYINPEIITDHEGRATITIPLADNITTWRMAMVASTLSGALGSGSSSIKVFQDFFADLDLPVTLTQGDRVSIPVAVYNYAGSKGDVSLRLQPEEWFTLADGDTADKSLTVEAGRVGGSQFTLEAKRIGKFKLTLRAQMNGQEKRADIVVREIEVIPNGREQSMVFNGRLNSAVRHELDFPADSIADARTIFVRLYPGPLSQVIEGMDSLLQMPFGCFEQTSSATYPNVLALDYMKRTKKLTPEVHAKAEGFIANGYQRLLTFEVPNGGFSWFGSAPANKILTSYGLMEFGDMSKVYDTDPKLVARTQQWLAGQQQPDGSWKPDTQFINEGATNRYNTDLLRITAYIAWALEYTGERGPAVDKAKQYVEAHLGASSSGKPDVYTLAVVANFAVDYAKDRDFARQAVQLLIDTRTEKDEQAWWEAEETGLYGRGTSAAVETTGLAVQALLKSNADPAVARKALNYITAKKEASGAWGTTQATIMALKALLLATEKGGASAKGDLEITLNGKPAGKLTLNAENNDLLHQFVLKGSGSEEHGLVEIKFTGEGSLAYQVAGRYFLPWDVKAVKEPLDIQVRYDRTHLTQDDIATATATVRNNLRMRANMVMVDLGIPPGFELLSEDLQTYLEKSASLNSGRLEKFNLTATQAILYFDSIAPGSEFSLSFRLRAKYPIRARTFASRVYEYYDPEVQAVARPVLLEVSKR